MKFPRTLSYLSVFAAALLVVGGCPMPDDPGNGNGNGMDDPNDDRPALDEFAIPADAATARVQSGQAVVYVIPDQTAQVYRFYLAEPGETLADREEIGIAEASAFGYGPNVVLDTPGTIGFNNELNRGVIGFADRSYVLNLEDSNGVAQNVSVFTATPLTGFGNPVINPTISPIGDRIAYETFGGEVGVSTIGFGGQLVDLGVLGVGVDPVFGATGTLGYADPFYDDYYVSDFGLGRTTRFGVRDTVNFNDPLFDSPFSRQEAGLSPDLIADPVTTTGIVDTTPVLFEPEGTFEDNEDEFTDGDIGL